MEHLTYSGKPINKMTYDELKLERTVQLWFAARMVRLRTIVEYGLHRRKQEVEEAYNIEDAEEQFKNGEIDEKELKHRKKNYKTKMTYIKKTEAEIEFCQIHENHARAMIAMIDEDLLTRTKPIKRSKPKSVSPYRKYPEELARSRRRFMERRYTERTVERNRMVRWQNKIESLGMGTLWDREKFMLICSDRGYVTNETVYVLIAEALQIQIKQVPILFDKGALTWGQVLTLGAELHMNPKEFCDTFLSGYFVEITDGVFEASEDNLPELPPLNNNNSDK